MSRLFSWDTVNFPDDSNAQHLIGVNQVPTDDCTSVGDHDAFPVDDGPEIDTVPEWDVRNFTITAWISLTRLPLGHDPSPSYDFVREKYGICVRDCLIGQDGGSSLINTGLWIQGTAGDGPPRLVLVVVRDTAIPIAASLTGVLPSQLSDPTYWMFCAGTHVLDAAPGPHLYTGDLSTPVSEVSAYTVQDPGSGPFGNPSSGIAGPSLSGRYDFVQRWFQGPVLIGQMCRPVPANGPNQHYGLQGFPNTGRGAMQGRISNVTIWGGALDATQLEWVRQNRDTLGQPTPPPGGFPDLLANWPLGANLMDLSGRNHHLQAVGPVQNPDAPLEVISPEEAILAQLDPQAYLRRRQIYMNTVTR